VSLVLDLRIVHDRTKSRRLTLIRSESIDLIIIITHLTSRDHRKTDRFFAVSGVQFAQSDRDQFHFRTVFSSHLKSSVGNMLVKEVPLRCVENHVLI
jgi:hypothetical protein